MALRLHSLTGNVWRILFASRVRAPLSAVAASEGRFHHSGQSALYASLSVQGAGVAIRRYIKPGDPDRVLVQLSVTAGKIVDLRDLPDPTIASQIWQDIRATGAPAPTWQFSDQARALGAQGMLYVSRSRPELTHMVLFHWNTPGAAQVVVSDGPHPWAPVLGTSSAPT